jgi:sec-independent protein translocase protein TatB
VFEVGFLELVLLAIVALLVFGPERMPGLVRDVGYWIGRIRRFVAAAKAEVDRELAVQDLKRSLEEQAKLIETAIPAEMLADPTTPTPVAATEMPQETVPVQRQPNDPA